MKQLVCEIASDPDLKSAITTGLMPEDRWCPLEIISLLDDPDHDENVKALLRQFPEKFNPAQDPDDSDYYFRVQEKFRMACAKVGIQLDD